MEKINEKRMRKYYLTGMIAGIFSLTIGITAFAGVWKKDEIGWWYDNGDGTWLDNGWEWIDDNGDGISECYYFNQEGYCLINTFTPDGYMVDNNGAWILNGIVQKKYIKTESESEKNKNDCSVYLLNEISPYKTPYWYNDNIMFSMGGETYTHGFTCMGYGYNPVGNQTYFNLDGRYSLMSFTAGIVEDRGCTVNFTFYADGELVYSFTMKSGDLPTDHAFSVEGCKQLMISVYDGNRVAAASGTYGLANLLVQKNMFNTNNNNIDTGLKEGEYYLLNVVEPYKTPFWYEKATMIKMGGQIYTHGFTCMGYGQESVGNETYFNLGGKYSTLSFIAGIVSDRERTVDITIYADGDVIYTFSIDSGALPTNHTVNITGCKQLVFAVYDGKWVADGSGTYGLANIIVK